MQNHYCWSDPSENPFEFIIDKLVALAPVSMPPDFSRILVIVPGRLWMRNLKTALVQRFPQGVCPPEILTPGGVLHYGAENLHGASTGEQLAVLEYVLKKLKDKPAFQDLFPQRDGACSDMDCHNLAKVFFTLRQELVQSGKTIADAAKILEKDLRWSTLAALESCFTAALKDFSLMDPAEAGKCCVSPQAAMVLSERFSHIIVAFLPDMPRLLEAKLTHLEDRITLLIHGEEKDADKFDAWGRPNGKWHDEILPVKTEHLHCVTNPEQAALLTLTLAAKDGSQLLDPAQSAVVLGKPGFFPAFEAVFGKIRYAGDDQPVTLFSPEGVLGARLRIAGFLQKLSACLRDENDFSAFNALLRDEAFSGYLRNGTGISENQFLGELDRFVLDALPDCTIPAIDLLEKKNLKLKALLNKGVKALRAFNGAADFCAELKKILKAVFSRPGYPPTLGISFDDEVNYWQKAITALQHSPIQDRLLPDAEQKLRYLLQDCETASFYPGRDNDAILVYNLLEFSALTQPELFLIGMNWGIVPAVPGNTPYLTNSIRKQLGLEDFDSLAALETYKVITLLKRKPDTHLVTLKFDETNTPMRPSGMLFNGCGEAELLARADRCRKAEILKECSPAATAGSHFCLNLKNIEQQLFFQKEPLEFSVTDFKKYLTSPRMFLVQKVFHIDCPDYADKELNAGDFGAACHKGLEKLTHAECATEEEYCSVLKTGADDYLRKYGEVLPFLVALQREQIYLRLKAAARYFAGNKAPFRLLATEYKINDDKGVLFGGALIKGTIDRIELSSDGKTLRLLDIKTYNTAKTPEKDHIKNKKFINLQLPLYHQLLLRDDDFWTGHNLIRELVNIEAGYLLLAADSDVAELKLWGRDFYDWSGKAEETVKQIVCELTTFRDTGKLPPEPKSVEYYDLAPLFLPNSQEAVFTEAR